MKRLIGLRPPDGRAPSQESLAMAVSSDPPVYSGDQTLDFQPTKVPCSWLVKHDRNPKRLSDLSR